MTEFCPKHLRETHSWCRDYLTECNIGPCIGVVGTCILNCPYAERAGHFHIGIDFIFVDFIDV